MKSNTARHLLAAAVCVLLLAAASAFGDEMALPWPDLSSAPRPAAKKGNSKSGDAALVIGISDYIFLDKVEGAVSNADDWREYLRKSRNIARQNIGFLTDKDATDVEIRSEARRIAALAKPGSTIWFVFIGHGAAASNGEEGLLVGADAQGSASGLDARSVRQSEIEAIFNKSKASRVVMIVDACFSGRTSEGKALAPGLQALVRPAQLKANARTILMTAARSDQFAGPLPGAHRPAFSYLLLGALRGWADENNDKTVTAEEALNYVQGVFVSLVRGHRQTPELTASNTNRQAVLAAHVSEKGPDIDAMVRQKFTRDVSAEAPVKNSNKNKINNKNNHDDDDDDDDNDNDKDDDDDDDNDNDNKKNNKAGEYIQIPAGSFAARIATRNHRGGDTVTLKAFELKKTPVTVAEFQKCVAAGACRPDNFEDAKEKSECNYNRGNDWLNHPMNCVTWEGAREYCAWSGGRLPTDDEWEYAAAHDGKAHLRTSYPWGNKSPNSTNANGAHSRRFSTSAVGAYSPAGDSPLGLVDMLGNVWEFTSSRSFGPAGYVVMGGSWKDQLRSLSMREEGFSARNDVGFRCAR